MFSTDTLTVLDFGHPVVNSEEYEPFGLFI